MSTFRSSPFSNIPPVVKNLLIINIIFFIATAIFESKGISLIELLGVYYFDSPKFSVWQLITYMFMHGGFAHILFNMFALFTFGSTVESIMGSKRFLNFYLITGLGALALQMVVQAIEIYGFTGGIIIDPATYQSADTKAIKTLSEIYFTPMVGASGAIFGLLIAFGMLFPNAELFIMFIPVPVKAKFIIPVYILLEFFLGVAQFAGDSIAHFAHLGGALFGFILVKLWNLKRPGNFYE
ncbi:rhomboid family intramembrane serine protease [Daejeonella oryzae]|uniref:rhomboid family intramembrane serine protease n=1 Tax=Daejeonella oryzae TaxID=1122943 RepID=UPI000420980B|nr:rhomboid family intramembrane serine protease [Daejeonella oryzae]